MWIGGIQWTTLLDYPGRVAATVFTAGCNFRCPFCHNPELVLPDRVSKGRTLLGESFFSALRDRRGFLDAVVLSGGEPTVQPDLPEVCQRIKDLGYLVKLDTNGTMPDVLAGLLHDHLIDYVAMDLKAPLEDYSQLTGVPVRKETIRRSIDLLQSEAPAHEFRTTVAPGLTAEDLIRLAEEVDGSPAYWLQAFRVPVGKGLVDDSCLERGTLDRADLETLWGEIQGHFQSGGVRG